MLAALRNLQSSLSEGLISDEEHALAKTAIMAGDLGQWGETPGEGVADTMRDLQGSVSQLMGMLVPDSQLSTQRVKHGSTDSDIKLQGLDTFAFREADANRDVQTGAMPVCTSLSDCTDDTVLESAVAAAHDSGDEEGDPEELSDNSHRDEDSSSESSDELDGEDFEPQEHSVEIHETLPDGYPHSLFGKCVYHRYDDGWYKGIVLRQVSCSAALSRNGKFAMKFSDSVSEVDHALLPDDYGPAAHWVVVK